MIASAALSAGLVLVAAASAFAQDPRGANELRGQLTPQRFTTLAAEIPAAVESVAIREGERFKAGDRLVVLDCSVPRAQLDRARDVLATAAKLNAAHKRLVETKSAGELEFATSAMEVAKASGDVRVLEATVSKCVVAAPFGGRVVEQKVRDQQFVQAGTALVDILDDTVLELDFIMPSRALAWLKVGHGFEVRIEELGRSYAARVSRIGAKVDPVSQSIRVTGEMAAAAPELVAGMSGRILISPP